MNLNILIFVAYFFNFVYSYTTNPLTLIFTFLPICFLFLSKLNVIIKSIIVKHCREFNHNFAFSDVYRLKSVSSTFDLDFFKSFFILKNENNIVNDLSSIPLFSQIWKFLL